jgi:CDP-6-deoxy-D-xylo-4-hexulose-3-dehydrase
MSNKIYYAPHYFQAYNEDEIDAVNKCLKDGYLAGTGKYTIEFENKMAELFGKKYGLFVNSGSSAIILGLSALELPKNSEIITPACTFATTLAPILQLGHNPVFIDVELDKYVPSLDMIVEKITENTKMILLPNLVGNTPNWYELKKYLEKINRNDIILFEDSADTIIYTPWTDISTTSFYSSHIITACGSGGMVMFNCENLCKRATMYRDWGRIGNNCEEMNERFQYKIEGTDIYYDFKFLYGVVGYNMKSSEVNAAFGLIQVEKLPKFIEIRRRNFNIYMNELKDYEKYGLILPKEDNEKNWLAFPLQYHDRYGLLIHLEENNIQTRVLFSGNITRHPAFRQYCTEYKNADIIMKDGFLVGCHHGMSEEDVMYVCNKIKEYIDMQHTK